MRKRGPYFSQTKLRARAGLFRDEAAAGQLRRAPSLARRVGVNTAVASLI